MKTGYYALLNISNARRAFPDLFKPVDIWNDTYSALIAKHDNGDDLAGSVLDNLDHFQNRFGKCFKDTDTFEQIEQIIKKLDVE